MKLMHWHDTTKIEISCMKKHYDDTQV
jgi:hypothetical protein